ncbi:voltage-gated chloride channel family protein [Cecembia lonarensis]|uniref:Putative voltage-gated ClC-type chloride channel ClcB n=1 Tax=Cecembia lonarensis (strain CCUG 58316 / KCTC 22772 / LW9) TaxID=1225176 RepID=K1L8C1_CECL9|nr:voltage-gated chloride channel family protein [Cecembia lonarensis]EKB48382.1 putative voltage-gated ClC-type chloride channel ClcB [Cecembia lonarensis LW9]
MLERIMSFLKTKEFLQLEFLPNFVFTIKWLIIAGVVAFLAGSASAFFLVSLDWVTNYREGNLWIIALLPLGGLIIGLTYHYLGESVVKGNNQLLEEFYNPQKTIPLRMAPLVLFGTLATHLFGGSAGREGTAVQMGGAIADQFTKWLKLSKEDRKILITIGVASGFASVFGTPLAGAVFALEWLVIGRIRYEAILPAFISAYVADYACAEFWNVHHTHYAIDIIPAINIPNLLWIIPAGIAFGLAGRLFAKATHTWLHIFKHYISYPPLRPVLGGILVALLVWAMGTTKYIGLGVPTIVDAFSEGLPWYDSLVKIFMTSLTLGAGFKGGEVTPLFYTGATLGNALSGIIPLPMALLAGAGFVGVFAGATNTPLACTLMGIELFGAEAGIFIGLACVLAYIFSGHAGIYNSQIIGSPKSRKRVDKKGSKLGEL